MVPAPPPGHQSPFMVPAPPAALLEPLTPNIPSHPAQPDRLFLKSLCARDGLEQHQSLKAPIMGERPTRDEKGGNLCSTVLPSVFFPQVS